MALAILVDAYLLYVFFKRRRPIAAVPEALGTALGATSRGGR
jgi:hypothetical protein